MGDYGLHKPHSTNTHDIRYLLHTHYTHTISHPSLLVSNFFPNLLANFPSYPSPFAKEGYMNFLFLFHFHDAHQYIPYYMSGMHMYSSGKP